MTQEEILKLEVGSIVQNKDKYEGEGDLMLITLPRATASDNVKVIHVNCEKHSALNGMVEIKDIEHLQSYDFVGMADFSEMNVEAAQPELEQPVELDWDEAKKWLDRIRKDYTEIGASGLIGLHVTINPLLIRYERGERTKSLYDDIMDLS